MQSADVERFYSHVLKGPEPDSCWLWLGAISDDGYGRFWLPTANGQRAVAAHRFALPTASRWPPSTVAWARSRG